MELITTAPKYEYIHGDNKFLFDSMEYECGTEVSKYEILTNSLSYVINGRVASKIILKGRFLKSDYITLENYIFKTTGSIIDEISINGRKYSKMVLIKGNAFLSDSSNIGEMTFELQEAK